jgi:hypothetical protein
MSILPYVFIKSKPGEYGIKIKLLLTQSIFMPTTCKYTLTRLMEQGRRSRVIELSKMSFTLMELEEVILLNISLQVVSEQISL